MTRKISHGVAQIHLRRRQEGEGSKGGSRVIQLGNLDARRDWGHARDFVAGVFAMMHHGRPDDYVLATGETRSVREFVEAAFAVIGVEIW